MPLKFDSDRKFDPKKITAEGLVEICGRQLTLCMLPYSHTTDDIKKVLILNSETGKGVGAGAFQSSEKIEYEVAIIPKDQSEIESYHCEIKFGASINTGHTFYLDHIRVTAIRASEAKNENENENED